MKNKEHTPDILNCLANLSNDEVFTPPELACKMLDMLPPELFTNPNTRFLDPVSKTGVFLREIAKRLMTGLEKLIPDRQKRIDHIFKNQIFGLAITELTAEMSRRTVYCSRKADSEYSVCQFADNQGNIRYKRLNHTWENGRCAYCGASQAVYEHGDDHETYAYQFIHTKNPQKLFNNMQFDVIIGNPPYQLDDGGNGASAKPMYHLFVEQAKKLNPRYLCMIIPARWYAGGKGLDDFRNIMLKDNRISEIHDFVNASECFPGVEIKGGVCYFLWNIDHHNECMVFSHKGDSIVSQKKRPLLEDGNDTFIRYNEAIDILRTIRNKKEKTFDTIVSSRKPFGFPSNFRDYQVNETSKNSVFIYAQREQGYIKKEQIIQNDKWLDMWKVYIPEAIGAGNMETDIIKPILGKPNTVCTETYLVIGPFKSKFQAENAISYIKTKFFHFLLGLKKITQHTTQKVYQFVPLQDFSHPWTDAMLYDKYGLTAEEISFIESMIRPME